MLEHWLGKHAASPPLGNRRLLIMEHLHPPTTKANATAAIVRRHHRPHTARVSLACPTCQSYTDNDVGLLSTHLIPPTFTFSLSETSGGEDYPFALLSAWVLPSLRSLSGRGLTAWNIWLGVRELPGLEQGHVTAFHGGFGLVCHVTAFHGFFFYRLSA